jgi:ABC-2 type transport system ATP-binding protein
VAVGPETELAISVKGLRKDYGRTTVLRGIDLEVRRGEVFGFLGPNGAGKTTTIEILEGYRSRTAGEVSVLGVDPAHPTRAWRERVGLVLQECELDPLLSVKEILTLYSSFYSEPRPIEEVVGLVGLTGREDSRLGTLSGGQRRRADVALSLIGDPELIFLDEPTTGFDPTARREAWNTISSLKELGKTIVLTTHYMDEAQHLSDRVAIIRAGEIIAEGGPQDLGRDRAGMTVISFRQPAGVDAQTIGAAIGEQPQVARSVISFEVDNAQRALMRLTTWADREGIELAGLEARQPTLEDVFIELTTEADRA